MAPPPRLARTQEFLIGRVPWLHSRTISNSRRRFVCGPVAARIVGKVRNLIESALHHLLACIWISCIFACDVKRNGTRWEKNGASAEPLGLSEPRLSFANCERRLPPRFTFPPSCPIAVQVLDSALAICSINVLKSW